MAERNILYDLSKLGFEDLGFEYKGYRGVNKLPHIRLTIPGATVWPGTYTVSYASLERVLYRVDREDLPRIALQPGESVLSLVAQKMLETGHLL